MSSKSELMMYLSLGIILIFFLVWAFSSHSRPKSSGWGSPSHGTINLPHINVGGIEHRLGEIDADLRAKISADIQARQRPNMWQVQEVCAGMDPTQPNGTPYTAECINSVFSMFGCTPRFAPGTPTDQINYNNTFLRNPEGVVKDAFQWASDTDESHRSGCYGTTVPPSFSQYQ